MLNVLSRENFILLFVKLLTAFFSYRSASLDVEPVYTFRGHTGAVLSLAVSSEGDKCFSGGLDGNIKIWKVPSSNIDPYDSYGKFECAGTRYHILHGFFSELLAMITNLSFYFLDHLKESHPRVFF